jgi:hypothetical protein
MGARITYWLWLVDLRNLRNLWIKPLDPDGPRGLRALPNWYNMPAMAPSSFFALPSRRRLVFLAGLVLAAILVYLLWSPGTVVTDGRHDLGRNGIWMSHLYLGDDAWFVRNHKASLLASYRDPAFLRQVAGRLREHHITDLFPHLCPAAGDGRLPPYDHAQIERVLDAFAAPDFRVLPWVGGVSSATARIDLPRWRETFVRSCRTLLDEHPRLAGVHLNIEPLASGNPEYLRLLEDLRSALGPGKQLSVAAYPPPTVLHPFPDVHWDQMYYRQVAARCDQMVVMLYDTGLHNRRLYQNLLRGWTREVIAWSAPTPVLLGVAAYEDPGVGYHDPAIENIETSIPALHAGLLSWGNPPANYQGVAVYSEWEMTDAKWQALRTHFERPR